MTNLEKLTFITDRTERDVAEVLKIKQHLQNGTATDEEKTKWINGIKGAINKSDLERIAIAIYCIYEKIEEPITLEELNLTKSNEGKLSTNLGDFVTQSYFEKILTHLNYLKNSKYVRISTPQVPNTPLNTYIKYNTIEKILEDVYEVLLGLEQNSIYLGNNEAFCNDNALI